MIALMLLSRPLVTPIDAYSDGIAKWRQERNDRLKAERGWLSVAGLYWLTEGENPIGSSHANRIVLPEGAPENLGAFARTGSHVTFQPSKDVAVMINGETTIRAQELNSDATQKPDRLTFGEMTLTVIQRGQRIGLRLYDRNARTLREFAGCSWYPVNPDLNVRAKFTPYIPPKPLRITNVLGDTSIEQCVGFASFRYHGRLVQLQALDEGDVLFFNFRDKTSGDATYGAGRFLYTDKPKNGHVDLDFNKAENPPCAFTNFATCPLAPKSNWLPIPIPAGEKAYVHH